MIFKNRFTRLAFALGSLALMVNPRRPPLSAFLNAVYTAGSSVRAAGRDERALSLPHAFVSEIVLHPVHFTFGWLSLCDRHRRSLVHDFFTAAAPLRLSSLCLWLKNSVAARQRTALV